MKMAQGFEAEGDRDVDECDAHVRVERESAVPVCGAGTKFLD